MYAQIVKFVGRNERTVGEYVRAYRKNGLEGLIRRASSVAPHKRTPEQEKELVKTSALIVSFVEQKWQKKYILRGMSRLLSSLGLSLAIQRLLTPPGTRRCRQAGYFFVKKHFLLKKRLIDENIDHLLFQDECMIRDYQAVQYTWFLRGKQRKIPTYGKHHEVKLISILNYETSKVHCIENNRLFFCLK